MECDLPAKWGPPLLNAGLSVLYCTLFVVYSCVQLLAAAILLRLRNLFTAAGRIRPP